MLQETVVFFDKARTSIAVPSDEENLDGLNYLAGREMSYINEKAMQATKAAHISGGVPVTEIRLPEICEQTVGALIYFFEYRLRRVRLYLRRQPLQPARCGGLQEKHVPPARQARLRSMR